MRLIYLVVAVLIFSYAPEKTYAADCSQAGNILSNCDFTINTADWSVFYGDSISHSAVDGATALGSVEINAQSLGLEFWARIDSACQPFPENTNFDWGFMAKLASGGADTSCLIRATFYSGLACTGNLGSTSSSSATGSIAQIDSTWQEGFADNPSSSPATTQSVISSVVCRNDSTDFVVRVDDVLLGQGLLPVELQSFSIE